MLTSPYDDFDHPEVNSLFGLIVLLIFLGGTACIFLRFVLPKKEADPTTPHVIRIWTAILRRSLALGLVLISVAMMFSVLTASSFVGIRSSKRAKTQNRMDQITTAFMNYETEYGKPPPAKDPAGFIQNLLDDNPRRIMFLNLRPQDLNSKGEPVDGWGTPFAITFPDPEHLAIRSAGPDRIWHTPDDLSSP